MRWRSIVTSFARLTTVFERLKAIMASYAGNLVIRSDSATLFEIDTRRLQPNGKSMPFGAIRIRREYVSYHLTPILVSPQLLAEVSKYLRSHIRDEATFAFTRIDESLFREVAAVTKMAYESFKQRGFV